MSNLITVQEYGSSQSGKPKVKGSGRWFFLGRDTAQPPIGASIEIKEGSFQMGDRTFATIEDWRLPAGGNGQQTQQHHAPAPAASPPAGISDYIREAQLRYISGVVQHAIDAGRIEKPEQIKSWHGAVQACLEGKSAPIPFDDETPDWARDQ